MNKLFYSYDNLVTDLHTIVRDMTVKGYRPDIVIGPGRGAYFMGVMLSHYFDVEFKGFNWQTRDGSDFDRDVLINIVSANRDKKILLVDDINDTGKTLQSIEDEMFAWAIDNVVDIDVTTATLLNKSQSDYDEVSYYARELTPDNNPWVVFPYEQWWNFDNKE